MCTNQCCILREQSMILSTEQRSVTPDVAQPESVFLRDFTLKQITYKDISIIKSSLLCSLPAGPRVEVVSARTESRYPAVHPYIYCNAAVL